MGLRSTGGSDAHGLHVLGRAYTVFASPVRTEAELVGALRAGEYGACWNTYYPAPQAAAGCSSQT